jgi:hypothetical protein
MSFFMYQTAEDFKDMRFGRYLLELVELLALPTPIIKASQLKHFNKEDLWGIRLCQQGRQTEPKTEDIQYKSISDSLEKGLNLVTQELIGRLCLQYQEELKDHYFAHLGQRDEHGIPYCVSEEDKNKPEALYPYLQDLELHLWQLEEDRRNELLKNDEIMAQVKETQKKIEAQEEVANAQEEKFRAQEKKFQSQEKRIRDKNKEIKTLKDEILSNDVEFEADRDLIETLRREKRMLQEKIEVLEKEAIETLHRETTMLQEKNEALEKEVNDYKEILTKEGITIEEVEEDEGDVLDEV